MSYEIQRHGMRGFGAFGDAAGFDANVVRKDQLAGAKGDNVAGGRFSQAMQAALNAVGNYGLPVSKFYGDLSQAAWKDFANKHSLTNVNPYPNSVDDLLVLQDALDPSHSGGGATEIPGSKVVGGQIIVDKEKNKPGGGGGGKSPPPPAAVAKAGMSGLAMAGIGIGALVLIGGLAYFAKKKGAQKKAGASAPGTPAEAYKANARRRVKRGIAHAKAVLSPAQFAAFKRMRAARRAA